MRQQHLGKASQKKEKKEIKKYRNFNPWSYAFIKNDCPFVGNTPR